MYNIDMKKTDNIRIYAWLELVVWIIIISVSILGIRYHNLQKQRIYKNYQVFLQDANGLIVGSPVKYLGVQIGYIKTIEIISSEVYIKFMITEKDLSLPMGVIATVESYGLGGSKALEIYPPDKNVKTDKFIVPKEPTRLGRVMGLFDGMFRTLDSILTTCTHFGDKLGLEPKDVVIEENMVTPVNNMNEKVNILDKNIDNIILQKNKVMKNLGVKDGQK